MLLLAAHDPVDHVLPHTFFSLPIDLRPFGMESIPLLNFSLGSGQFNFTNHLLMSVVAALLCLLIFPRMARAYAGGGSEPYVPRGVNSFFETMMQFIRQQVAEPVLQHRTDQYISFLWTLFFFILFCNLLGMVPLDSIVYLISGRTIQHVGGTATGNLAVTGGLAICAFIMIHVAGVREVYRELVEGTFGHHHEEEEAHGHPSHEEAQRVSTVPEVIGGTDAMDEPAHGVMGPVHPISKTPPARAAALAVPLYVWNFAPHVFRPDPDAGLFSKLILNVLDFGMWVVLLVLELIGAVIKPFALMIRLFANMVAGHIVLASILMLIFAASTVGMGYTVGLISVVGCVAISCLELFVAFLQAYIFVFLTTLFISMSVAPEH